MRSETRQTNADDHTRTTHHDRDHAKRDRPDITMTTTTTRFGHARLREELRRGRREEGRGTEELYVAGGATAPTSLGVNPQLTIMALATRFAERMLDRRVD